MNKTKIRYFNVYLLDNEDFIINRNSGHLPSKHGKRGTHNSVMFNVTYVNIK